MYGQVIDPTKTARNFMAGELTQAAWQLRSPPPENGPAFSTDAAEFQIDPSWHSYGKIFRIPFNTWFPESSILNGQTQFPQYAMQLTFDANWTFARSYGTCYVWLPNLTSPPNPPPQQFYLKPGSGSVKLHLQTTTGAADTVDTSSSVPPPTDPRGPTWTCDVSASLGSLGSSNCGAIAVVDQPNANRDTQIYLLIAGTFIGLGFAVFAEAFLKWNWPLPQAESADSVSPPLRDYSHSRG